MNSLPKQADSDAPAPSSGADVDVSLFAVSGAAKEHEPLLQNEAKDIHEYPAEFVSPPELKRVGVIVHRDQIDVSPDVAAMGVETIGIAQPHAYTGAVQLPLTDDQIMVGLHAQIISSLRWLSEWCIKQLKRAHVHLRSIGGKVVRENDQVKKT